jgi:hypothetical protein
VTAVWIRFRAEFRSRWRSWLGLVLVASVAGGLVLGLATGARRTETALDRYFVATQLGDAYVYRGPILGQDTLDFDRIGRLPQVVETQRSAGVDVISRSRAGRPIYPFGTNAISYWVRTDGKGMRSIDGGHLLAGRLPDTARADEAIAEPGALRALGLHIGDTLVLRLAHPRYFWIPKFAVSPVGPRAATFGPLARVRIVGEQASIHPGVEDSGRVYLTPAFYRAYGGSRAIGIAAEELAVRLRHGQADVPAFRAQVASIAGRLNPGFSNPRTEWTASAQRPLTLLGRTLQLLAVIAGIAALMLVGQALFRQARLESAEDSTLRALGMSRSQLVQLGTIRAATIALPAAGLALVLAFLLSALAPVGRARVLDPNLGFAVDGFVLARGAAIVLGCVLVMGVAASWWVARRGEPRLDERQPGRSARHSRVASAIGKAGWPPPAVTGVRMALVRGSEAAATRATLIAAILAVAVTATAFTFAGSLTHLLDTPRLYGQTWDFESPGGGPALKPALLRRLAGDPGFSAIAIGATYKLQINGVTVFVRATEDLKGSVPPAVIEGRAPRASGEVVLGTITLHKLSAHIGDVVTLRRGKLSESLRIVGRGVLAGGQDPGDGAALTFQSLQRVEPDAVPNAVTAQVAPHTDRRKAVARLSDILVTTNTTLTPFSVGDFGGVSGAPYLIAGLFAAAAAAALAHALVTSARRRRRELAILKTIGFTRRQVFATVAWQATTVASVGLLIGLPLGLAVGRFVWNVFADDLGVVPEVVTPPGLILLTIPATLLLANLIATLPGRIAARTQPAVALRAE